MRRAVVVTVLALALTGCTGGDDVVVSERAGTRTFVNPPADGDFSAEVTGRLGRTDGGCPADDPVGAGPHPGRAGADR